MSHTTSSTQVPETLAIDAGRPGLFGWLYARLGRHYLTFLLTCAALSLSLLAAIASVVALTYLEGSFSEYVEVGAVVALWGLVFGVVAELGVGWVLTPLRRWLRSGCAPRGALAAWTSAIFGPVRAIPILTALALVAAVPIEIYVSYAVLGTVIPATAIGVIGGFSLFILAVAVLHYLVWEQALKPLVIEAARCLPADFTVPRRSLSLSARVVMLIPIVNVVTAFIAVAAGRAALTPGTRIAIGFAVAVGVTVLVALPLTLMLRRSLLDPMGRLLTAMGHVGRGDLETRLPLLTADELATVAQHFNQMVEGLKERERLSGENVQLEAKVREQLEEVLASRARIIAASDAERRRVERNLHDGAQQRLVALALELRLLERQAEKVSEPLRGGIARANENLAEALAELKELARGLHPQILTTDGLRPAIRQLAARASVPVEVSASDERYPEALESTAYFVVSEALANVAKYSRASSARVSVERRDGRLEVEVADDGVGGADAGAGSGLSGLEDRVAALDGTLAVDSPPGAGTTVRARLPLGA